MNLLNGPEIKVGALVILVSALIGLMSIKVTQGPGMFGGNRYYFDLEDAGGLVKNSAVKMAGIKVGTIDEIELVDGKARVHVAIDGDYDLTQSAVAEIRADGILGDKHVEIIPGKLSDPKLAQNSQIGFSPTGGSLDDVMKSIGNITNSLTEVADNFNKATRGEGDPNTVVGRILQNIEKLTADVSKITSHNKDEISEIVRNLRNTTRTLDEFINDDGPEGFRDAWHSAMAGINRLDNITKNVEDVTAKINRGEGTVGRLINDEETVDELNETIANFNNFFGNAASWETSIDYHSEYLGANDLTKSYLSVRIQPGPDRYYELGVVDDPKGVTNETTSERTVDGGDSVTTVDRITYTNKTKLRALFAKNFYDFTVKGGLFENSGGVGLDYWMLGRKLRFSIEAFDFDDLYIRTFAQYNFFKGIYVIAGGDDVLDADNGSAFLGAGVFITNDDLRLLATRVAF